MDPEPPPANQHNLFAQGLKKRIQSVLPTQRWRLWAGSGLALLIVVTGASLVMRKRSIEAYVTADVITIESPIDGIVAEERINAGDLFQPNQTIIRIKAARDDETELREHELRLFNINTELKALEEELKIFAEVHLNRLRVRIDQAERNLKEVNAQLKHYRTQTNRYEQLNALGAISQDKLSEARAKQEGYQQRSRNEQQIVDKLKLELDQVLLDPSASRSSLNQSSRQMEIMDIEFLRNLSLRQSLTQKKERLEEDWEEASAKANFTYAPNFPGMVLTSRFSVGDEVMDGNTLLTIVNCADLKVEALFESSKIRTLQVGQTVIVEWPRNNERTTGTIVSFRGEQGINGLETSGVAKFRPAHVDRTRAIIAIPTKEAQQQQCRLGERVRVEL